MARWLVIACATLIAVAPASAASLDPSFGNGGRVVVDLGPQISGTAGDLAIQPDGKIVASGWVNGGLGVVRLLPDGRLDPSFGTAGVAAPVFGAYMQNSRAPRLALQPDGKIVVVGPAMLFSPGATTPPTTDFGVMRLTAEGALDPDFGEGGKAVFPVGTSTDIPQALVIQPDGKIVVAGSATVMGGANSDFAAIRLTPHGRLDTSFGTGGSAVVPMIPDSGLDSASEVGLLPDGHILVAGVTAREATGFDIAVVRLTSDGVPDATFGNEGRAEFALGTGAWQEIVRSLHVFPDGSFSLGGSALPPGFGPSQVALTHFTAAGVADNSFVRALGTVEDTSSGIVVDGTSTWLAVDSRVGNAEREIGVLEPGGEPFLFNIRGGDERAAAIAERADGVLIELASVKALSEIGGTFGLAAIAPHGTQPVPPPPDPTPIEKPIVVPRSTVAFPRAGATLHRVIQLRGSARAGGRIQRVEIALTRKVGGRCMLLRDSKPSWRRAKCSAQLWRTAKGTTSWSFRLKRALPKGRYTLYSRATAKAGTEPPHRGIAFTVR